MRKLLLFFMSMFTILGTSMAQDDALALEYVNPSNGGSEFSVYNIRLQFNKDVVATLPEGGIDVKNNNTGDVVKITRLENNEWLEKSTVVFLFEQEKVVGKEGKEELMDKYINTPGEWSYTVPAGCIKSVEGEEFAEQTFTFRIAAPLAIESVSPAGATTVLDKIEFTFSKAIAKVEMPASGMSILDSYWMPVVNIKKDVTYSDDHKTVILELEEPITAPGMYNLDIYQGIFTSEEGEINEYTSVAFEIIDPTPSFSTNLKNGDRVQELKNLEITFNNVKEVKLVDGAEDIIVYMPGAGEAIGTATLADNKITITFDQEFNEEGEYTFVIPAGVFTMDGVPNEDFDITVTLFTFVVTPLEIVYVTPLEGEVDKIEKVVVQFNQLVTLSMDEYWQAISDEIYLKNGDKTYTLTYCPSSYSVTDKIEYLVNAVWNGYEYASTPITAAGTYTLDLSDIVVDYAGEEYTDEWGWPATLWHGKKGSCEGTCTWTISDGNDTTAPEVDMTKAYRVKDVASGNYLLVNEYNINSTGATGTVIMGEYAEDGDQIFNIEDAGNGKYYVKSLEGHYIVCREWNVDACDDGLKTELGFEFINDTEFHITNSKGYFKVETVNNVAYPFCDAGTDLAATWVLEEATIPTGINSIDAEKATSTIYDLTGRRIENITNAGIYIVNGKKVIVK